MLTVNVGIYGIDLKLYIYMKHMLVGVAGVDFVIPLLSRWYHPAQESWMLPVVLDD